MHNTNLEADGIQQPKTMTGSTSISQEQKSQSAVMTGSAVLKQLKTGKIVWSEELSTEAHRKPMKTGHMFSKNLNAVNAIQLTCLMKYRPRNTFLPFLNP